MIAKLLSKRKPTATADFVLVHTAVVFALLLANEAGNALGAWYSPALSNILFVYSGACLLLSLFWLYFAHGLRQQLDLLSIISALFALSALLSSFSSTHFAYHFFGFAMEAFTPVSLIAFLAHLVALRFLFKISSAKYIVAHLMKFSRRATILFVVVILLICVLAFSQSGEDPLSQSAGVSGEYASEALANYIDDADIPTLFLGGRVFPEVWAAYQPQAYNLLPTWSQYISHSSNILSTIFVELGLLGTFSFIILLGYILFLLSAVFILSLPARRLGLILLSGVAISLVTFWLFNPHPLFAMAASFCVAATLSPGLRSKSSFHNQMLADATFATLFIVVLVFSVQWGYNLSKYDLTAHRFLNSSTGSALSILDTAVHPSGHPQMYWVRALLRKQFIEESLQTQKEEFDLEKETQLLIADATTATLRGPNDYITWSVLAKVYILLRQLALSNAAVYGYESIEKAKALAPNHPGVVFTEAELSAIIGDYDRAREALVQVQILKYDLPAAKSLLEFIENNN